MKFQNKYRTSSVRLPHWDYSSEGYYYVTICTKNKRCCLGEVLNGKTVLSKSGEIVYQYWTEIPKEYPNTLLDIFQIMPNHLHVILIINDRCRDLINQISTNKENQWILMKNNMITLGKIIRFFKGKTCHEIREKIDPAFSWQPNYYEHVIRNDHELAEIREYIQNNPLKWELDEENPNKLMI